MKLRTVIAGYLPKVSLCDFYAHVSQGDFINGKPQRLAVLASARGDWRGVFLCLQAGIPCSCSIITAVLQTVLEFSGF